MLVQLFWAYYVLPFFGLSLEAFAAGVLTLGMNFGAYGAEVVRAGILAVPKGPVSYTHIRAHETKANMVSRGLG